MARLAGSSPSSAAPRAHIAGGAGCRRGQRGQRESSARQHRCGSMLVGAASVSRPPERIGGCPRATPKRRVQWRCRSVGGADPAVAAGRPGRWLRRLAPSRPAVRRQRNSAARAMGSDPSNTCVSMSPLPVISMATCRGRRCRARGRGRRWRCRDGRYSALAVAAWSCCRLRRVAVVSVVLAARPLGTFGTAVRSGSGVCSAAQRAGTAVLWCGEPVAGWLRAVVRDREARSTSPRTVATTRLAVWKRTSPSAAHVGRHRGGKS